MAIYPAPVFVKAGSVKAGSTARLSFDVPHTGVRYDICLPIRRISTSSSSVLAFCRPGSNDISRRYGPILKALLVNFSITLSKEAGVIGFRQHFKHSVAKGFIFEADIKALERDLEAKTIEFD
jgi:hypothetical protein